MVEVRIEGYRLDVFEGFDFSFNYGVADIRNPEKRSTEYSKTIKCPATKSNDELFGHIYDVNISNNYDANISNISVNFNPNKKAEARVIADGVEVMAGVVQLRKIVQKGHAYTYEVVFIGKLLNIFSVLGDKELSGVDESNVNYLDFSEFDHYYTYQNQVDSWSAPVGDGYVYPLIDWGGGEEFTNQGNRIYEVGDLRPAYYAKTILNKIFDFAGFSYQSSFLDSVLFNRLVIPVTKPLTISEDNLQEKLYKVGKTVTQNAIINATTNPAIVVGNQGFFNNPNSTPRVCYSNEATPFFDNGQSVTGNYLVPADPFSPASQNYKWLVDSEATGFYDLTASVDLRCTEWGSIAILRAQTGESGRNQFSGKLRIMRKRNNSVEVMGETDWGFTLGLTSGYTTPPFLDQNVVQNTYVVTAENVQALEGDEYYVDLIADEAGIGYTNYFILFHPDAGVVQSPNIPYYLDFDIRGGEFYNEYLNEGITEGEFVDMTDNLPDIGMSEFLTSIFKMFNLYVEVDPNNEKNLLIETRDTFYSQGGTKDWTYKLARDKDISLEPLGVLTDREYIYTYSEDGDYYNERYQNNRGHVYGRSKVEVDNDFVQSSKEVEVVFSPSPLVNDNPSNRIIPAIWDADIEEGAKPTDANIRILYYGGLISSDPVWVHRRTINLQDTYNSTYPYAGHWDEPITPTVDINFGLPYELYYQANSYTGTVQVTNANLFNIYHRNYINEVTDKDSKVMTGLFYLEPTDINKLDFRDQIVIDNAYWRLNKVMNYNPFKEGLTKVELIKIKEPVTFQKGSKSLNSSGYLGLERLPNPSTEIKTNGNKYPPFQGKVSGAENNVGQSVTAFKVVGSRNTIGEGAKNITIFGNDNEVRNGVFNVQLINTNGVVVTESNVTYVNGKEQDNVEVLEGGENEVRALNGGTNIFTVDGGEDIVQTQFSEIAIYTIEGGEN